METVIYTLKTLFFRMKKGLTKKVTLYQKKTFMALKIFPAIFLKDSHINVDPVHVRNYHEKDKWEENEVKSRDKKDIYEVEPDLRNSPKRRRRRRKVMPKKKLTTQKKSKML